MRGSFPYYRSLAAAIAASLLSVPLAAQAAFFSGDDLRQMIDGISAERPLTPIQRQGLGYIQGVYDANAGNLFCSREGVDVAQMLQVIRKAMLEHPRFLPQPASLTVTAALIDAYPCPRQPGQ